ncbi:spore coat protein, partial [Neobacillus drentensis]
YMSLDPYITSNPEALDEEKKVIFDFIQKRSSYIMDELTTFK